MLQEMSYYLLKFCGRTLSRKAPAAEKILPIVLKAASTPYMIDKGFWLGVRRKPISIAADTKAVEAIALFRSYHHLSVSVLSADYIYSLLTVTHARDTEYFLSVFLNYKNDTMVGYFLYYPNLHLKLL